MEKDKKTFIVSLCFYTLLLLNYVALIIAYMKESPIIHNWIMLSWWFFNFVCALLFIAVKTPSRFYQKINVVIHRDWGILLALSAFIFLTRFFLIHQYPYISLGDELRDAGLNALKIKQGIIKDFFDFGNYQGYGNFIPLISSFFIPFFTISPLTYRLPSALFGAGAIFFTYVLGCIAGGRKAGIIASLLLTGSLLHLHYSRTELLVIADSLLSPLIILAVYSSFYYVEGFFLTGLMVGFSMHFYAGIRGIIAASFLHLIGAHFTPLIFSLVKKEKQSAIMWFKRISIGAVLFGIGFIIALGPTIMKLQASNIYSSVGTTQIIFQTKKFNNKKIIDKMIYVLDLYKQSFLSYTFKPTNDFHFVYYQKRQKESLLPSPLNWLFIVGLTYIVIKCVRKKKFFQLLLSIVIIFPIFNEVLVETIGFDHRLMSIMPVLMVVTAVGAISILSLIKNQSLQKIFIALFLFIYLLSQLRLFFIERVSDYGFDRKEYIFQEMLHYIKTDIKHTSYYVLYDEIYPFNLLHYQEKAVFFTYPKNVSIINKERFMQKITQKYEDNEATNMFLFINPFAESNRYPKKEIIKNCVQKKYFPDYTCPLHFQGSLRFYLL